MKKLLILTFLFLTGSIAFSQALKVNVTWNLGGEEGTQETVNKKNISVLEKFDKLFKIKIQAQLAASHELKITINGETKSYQKTNNSPEEFTFTNNIIGNEIHIEHFDVTTPPGTAIGTDDRRFKIINDLKEEGVKDNTDNITGCISCLINARMATYSYLTEKPFGLYDEEKNTVHLFFDYFGNSLLSTIPQGIANAKYKIHILYPIYASAPDELSYSVKQKTGSFSSALVFNNSDIRNTLGKFMQQSGKEPDGIGERAFLLGTATDDLSFDIIVSSIDGKAIKKTVLESYTIKMSPVYHGSFDVGLLKTNLANPSFNLVTAPIGSDMVVKETDGGSKGVVTIMASFYVSPIILIESLFGKKHIPFYKLTGRSFLDDHKFYERIYPAIGVSISSKTFENLFYGLNFEVARGLNLFAGWNYGKVNVFKMPGYVEGTTVVNQQQFDFYKNTEWKVSTAIGVKVDALIIKTLFGAGL